MKIVKEEFIKKCGPHANSREWNLIRRSLHEAVLKVHWPENSKRFLIYPESGKKRGEGNGVKPTKAGLLTNLETLGWLIEAEAKGKNGRLLGRFDAVFQASFGPCVLEWEFLALSGTCWRINTKPEAASKSQK